MKTKHAVLILFATLSLASPAQAQAIRTTGTGVPVSPMVAVIAQTFRDINDSGETVANLDLQSLTYFATEDFDLNLRIENAPDAFSERLTEQLEAEFLTRYEEEGFNPEKFMALPLEKRTEILRAAGTNAESKAKEKAEAFISKLEDAPLDTASTFDYEREAKDLIVQAAFLKRSYRSQIKELLTKIERGQAKFLDKAQSFREALPGMIAADWFKKRTIYKESEDGILQAVDQEPEIYTKSADGKWQVADLGPEMEFDTLEDAFNFRINEIAKNPAGSWSQEILVSMQEALNSPSVIEALKTEGGEVAGHAMMIHEAMVGNGIRTKDIRKKLRSPIKTFNRYKAKNRPPPVKDIEALVDNYDQTVRHAPETSLGYRINKALYEGDPDAGYPAFEELKAMVKDAYNSNVLRFTMTWASLLAGILGLSILPGDLTVNILMISLFVAGMANLNITIRETISSRFRSFDFAVHPNIPWSIFSPPIPAESSARILKIREGGDGVIAGRSREGHEG